MRIEQGNLVIRSAAVEDAVNLNMWWNDGKVMEHAGFPNGLGQSMEETRAEIEANRGKLSQLVILEVDGKSVGEASFRLIEEGKAEIGIKICDFSYQNHGYGTRFLKMLMEYLFEDEELAHKFYVEKIVLNTNKKNVRAQHVYEKLGFMRLRENKDSWKNQLGEWQTSIDYEMARRNYKNNFLGEHKNQ